MPDPDLSAELTAAAPSPGAASAGRPSQSSVEIGVTLIEGSLEWLDKYLGPVKR